MDRSLLVTMEPAESTERLDEWLSHHGPLSVPAALLVALELCEQVSHMTRSQRRATRRSLHTSCIVRTIAGGWRWQPQVERSSGSGAGGSELVERLGRVLFHMLTADPLGDSPVATLAVGERLRRARRDAGPDVIELTVQAVAAARGQRGVASFARELSQILSRGQPRVARRSRRITISVGSALALVLATWWLGFGSLASTNRTGGVTADEATWYDIVSDAAQTFAIIDEHTAAIQQYQAIARFWRARLSPEDPRLAWTMAQEAWVRTLSGDRLTAEQLLENSPGWLAAELGETHPYVRTTRLTLAAALLARGETSEAAALQSEAARATRALLGSDEHRVWLGVPGAPGVVAHVAPNAPEREGFLPVTGGGFFAPLTSAQRMLTEGGGRGWQLHVVAGGICHVAVDTGVSPRRLTLDTIRNVDGTWDVRIDGATAAHPLTASTTGDLVISIVGGGAGRLDVKVGNGAIIPLKANRAAPSLPPPYGVTFRDGASNAGCKVVWLEIQFATAPTRGPVEPPTAPPAEPSRLLVQHQGQADPTTEGFRDRGGLDRSGPVSDDEGHAAWLVAGRGCCSYYHHPLDVTRAFSGEWRLTADLRVVEGPGYAEVGINPDSTHARFDVGVHADGADAVVSLGGSPLTYRIPDGLNQWVHVELRYDPASRSASLFVNGALQISGYAGWTFARENKGILFGAYDALAHYRLVRFETLPPG